MGRPRGTGMYLVAAGSVLGLLVLTWLRVGRRAGVVAAALGLVGLTLVAALVVSGPRWFAVPIALAALVAAAVAMARQQGRLKRWIAIVLTAVTALTALVAGACAWALPALRWPTVPTGPVGTTTIQWQSDRDEPATKDPSDRRVLVAQVWYPAVADTGSEHHYWGGDAETRTVSAALAKAYGIPAFTVDGASRAITLARQDAQPAAGHWPVVILSPGLGGLRTQNTALAQDLAGRGMVVIALDHPYDSAVTVLRDGTALPSRTTSTGNDAQDQKRADGWARTRAADLRSTLTLLDAWRAGHPPTLSSTTVADVGARLDLSRVALIGHSLGGAAAILAASEEPRFSAVINLDGLPRGGQPTQPLLTLIAGDGLASQPEGATYRATVTSAGQRSSCAVELTVAGASHLSLTDAGLFLPPLPVLLGSNSRGQDVVTTSRATNAFLGAVWQANASPQQAVTGLGSVSGHCP